MDVGSNKTRKDTRAVVSLTARYRSPSTFEYVEDACCDVSVGGMFIKSEKPAAAGTLIKLECETPVGASIRGVARVVWLRTERNEYGPSGMGVKFVKLEPESREVITHIVQELAAAGIESPSMSSAPEDRGKPPSKRANAGSDTKVAPLTLSGPSADVSAARSSAPASSVSIESTRSAQQEGSEPDTTRSGSASDRSASDEPSAAAPSDPRAAPASTAMEPASAADSQAQPAASSSAPIPALEPAAADAMSQSQPTSLGDATEAVVVDDDTTETPESAPSSEPGEAPIAPLERAARSSSEAPAASEPASGRAFWLVAAAVVALGVIVSVFASRSLQHAETASGDRDDRAARQARPLGEETPKGTGSERAAEPLARAESSPTQAPRAQTSSEPEPATAAEATHNVHPAQEEPVAASAVEASSDNEAPAQTADNEAPAQTALADTAASAEPEASQRAAQQAEPAAVQEPDEANTQTQDDPSAETPAPAASTSGADPTAPRSEDAPHKPPPLGPGEVAHIVVLTSRPNNATITVDEQVVVAPAEVNLGNMPGRVRVYAEKQGYEPSSAWISSERDFHEVDGVMRREVHMVLPPLPAANTTAPDAPNAPAPRAPTEPASPPTASETQAQGTTGTAENTATN